MSHKGDLAVRTCVGCRKRRKKEEMLRFTEEGNGKERIDMNKKVSGRGFYLCPDVGCFNSARKKRRRTGDLESAERFMALSMGSFGSPGDGRLNAEEEKEWRK